MNSSPTSCSVLRADLQAAMNVLEVEGRDALVLERVARRAGRLDHRGQSQLTWDDERAMQTELTAYGYRRLAEAIQHALDESQARGGEVMEDLFSAGRAYVRNAVSNPRLFALMRDTEAVDFAEPRLQNASRAAFTLLQSIVDDLHASGFETQRSAADLCQLVWDSVHRLAQRWADAAVSETVATDTVDEAIELELTLLLADPSPNPPDDPNAPNDDLTVPAARSRGTR